MPSRPIMRAMCATCPFRKGSEIARIAGDLAHSALTEASRICHSTGGNDLVIPAEKIYSQEPHICRGARNVQLDVFYALRMIDAPTDEAWERACERMGIVRDAI